MSISSTVRGRLGALRVRAMIILALAVVLTVTVGVAVLAMMRVRAANAEVVELGNRNVQRLTVMGEIRGEQARMNDAAVRQYAPGLPPAVRVAARQDMLRSMQTMDQLMNGYEVLVRGTPAQASFAVLQRNWREFHNGITVYGFGGRPVPGVRLPAPTELGPLTVSVTSGLDAQSKLEQAGAEAVAAKERATARETIVQVGGSLLVGLLAALAVGLLAVRAEARRRRTEQRFRALVQSSADVICVLDEHGRHTYLSPSVQKVTGYRPEDLTGVHYEEIMHPEEQARLATLHQAVLSGGSEQEHRTEVRLRHADGTWHWHDAVARNLLHDPAVRGIVINHRDITERRRFQDQLAYDATHDQLTALANRAAFMAELRRALGSPGGRQRRTAVLYVDLNGFKPVNDTWGHETGDALLVAVARVLERSVLGADTVARLGGDEFGIVLGQIDQEGHAEAVARRIVAGLAEPLDIGAPLPVHVRASIGIAVSGPDCTEPDELMRRADLAMYDAKRRQLDGWQVYSDRLQEAALVAAPTVEELRHAIAADQLVLQYQPIVALHSGALLGVEALVRWQHPVLGYLGPQHFIPLAESSGLIVPLGEWVLRRACAQVRQWQRSSEPERRLQLSVNLSPRQLDYPMLATRVLDALRSAGLDPHDLILEITEDALVDDERAIAVLAELRSHGIRLALDDFGTGYSSLRYLTNLPVDILKLDRCFVAELDGTTEGSAVAEAVIRLSQALNLDTIAEGIETVAQATELTLLGCPLAQGYHFARPLDADALQALLDNGPGAELPALHADPADTAAGLAADPVEDLSA